MPIVLFTAKAKELYEHWKKRQTEPIAEENELKFSPKWIKDWMTEYNVSLCKPNKRFAIKQEDRVERLLDYYKNMMRLRKYFLDNFGEEPEIYNGDQMPVHRYGNSGYGNCRFLKLVLIRRCEKMMNFWK